jgi:DUF1680 family protein
LFLSSEIHGAINGVPVTLKMDTQFPNQGKVSLHVIPETPVEGTIALRLPSYGKNWRLTEHHNPVPAQEQDGYLLIKRKWTETVLTYEMELTPHFVFANPKVRASSTKAAVMKGPLVYCLEEVDNGKNLAGVFVDTSAGLTEEFVPDLCGGVTVLHAKGKRLVEDDGTLYRDTPTPLEDTDLTLLPYHCWNNRTPGEMTVWMNHLL